VLQRVAACCSVLQRMVVLPFWSLSLICVAACCSVLQRVAACCSVLQRVAEYGSVAFCSMDAKGLSFRVFCVAACCSVLQCVSACRSVLQCCLLFHGCERSCIPCLRH